VSAPSTLWADAHQVLAEWVAPTPAQEVLRRRYLAHLVRHGDAMQRSCHPAHLTASALVLSPDHDRVLLTLHAKAGRWFQLGGHTEHTDPTLLAAARREAEEESGVHGLRWHPTPVHLDAHRVQFCHPRGPVDHLDVRYVAVAPPGAVPVRSEESHEVAWWPAKELPTEEPSMRELVDLARRSLQIA
jgi:8-oxo-dGTP pyrophosphatase MutT (NUDIX family)